MATVTRVKISSRIPFPAGVAAGGVIQITKLNGIWTIGLNIPGLASQVPPPTNWANDYIVFYDSVAQTYFKSPLGGPGSLFGRVRQQRSVTASPIVVAPTDEFLNCSITTAATCALPAAASRAGLPLTFKDVGAQFAAHNLTITPNGAETIDGASSLVLNFNRQEATLVPFNDGVNTGWFIS